MTSISSVQFVDFIQGSNSSIKKKTHIVQLGMWNFLHLYKLLKTIANIIDIITIVKLVDCKTLNSFLYSQIAYTVGSNTNYNVVYNGNN